MGVEWNLWLKQFIIQENTGKWQCAHMYVMLTLWTMPESGKSSSLATTMLDWLIDLDFYNCNCFSSHTKLSTQSWKSSLFGASLVSSIDFFLVDSAIDCAEVGGWAGGRLPLRLLRLVWGPFPFGTPFDSCACQLYFPRESSRAESSADCCLIRTSLPAMPASSGC